MENVKLFVKTLHELGFEANSSSSMENYHYTTMKFHCESLSDEHQEPISVDSVITDNSLHLSLCHVHTIILRPFDDKLDWSTLTESQTIALAHKYHNCLNILLNKAKYLMAPFDS